MNPENIAASAIMALQQARIDKLESALRDMVGLFSADDMLLKGTQLHVTLDQAHAAMAEVAADDKASVIKPYEDAFDRWLRK